MTRDSISKLLNRLSNEGKDGQLPGVGRFSPTDPDNLPPRPDESSRPLPSDTKICIVGAGISGLYAGLILDHLGVAYDLLEASPRPGGRKRTDVPLIDYYLNGENTPKRYNGITVFPPKDGTNVEEDPFHDKMVQEFGHVPELETGKNEVAHLLVALGMLRPEVLAGGEKKRVEDVMKGKGHSIA
ncbi:MAG: hypothetical protein Q9211_000872 [Gyalolechia sp. 1 TL-2023]